VPTQQIAPRLSSVEVNRVKGAVQQNWWNVETQT